MYTYIHECIGMYKVQPELSNLESHSCIGLTAEQSLTVCVQVHFETEVLVALEYRIFHYLPKNILQLPNPEVQVLVAIRLSLTQVETLDATVFYSLLHSPVQIWVHFFGVELRDSKHCNGLLELNVRPSVKRKA